jgi:hypothetical protein
MTNSPQSAHRSDRSYHSDVAGHTRCLRDLERATAEREAVPGLGRSHGVARARYGLFSLNFR